MSIRQVKGFRVPDSVRNLALHCIGNIIRYHQSHIHKVSGPARQEFRCPMFRMWVWNLPAWNMKQACYPLEARSIQHLPSSKMLLNSSFGSNFTVVGLLLTFSAIVWFTPSGPVDYTDLFQYIGYSIAVVIYNVYFHPLTKFPGPKLRAASVIPAWITMWTGAVLPFKELHDKYGTVVRTAPDSLSFNSPGGWKGRCS